MAASNVSDTLEDALSSGEIEQVNDGVELTDADRAMLAGVPGLVADGVGAEAANIVPSEAVAEIDMRTTPATDGRRLYSLAQRHIEARALRQARELHARFGGGCDAHAGAWLTTAYSP